MDVLQVVLHRAIQNRLHAVGRTAQFYRFRDRFHGLILKVGDVAPFAIVDKPTRGEYRDVQLLKSHTTTGRSFPRGATDWVLQRTP